ncbi:unnamed protein product [Vitrella brassicaformis CCMP3155]|uniref:Helicase ATP-binding domain-containing protein n=1 Tax=Vitrella brassicaformis (strain CCMP3155) TaxID=1169540 RepID=A0A0G4GYD1_VITBC|nr:unnamed protein product [Vitrella brassicaformis CCMP3155]|eukprot:CEM36148.1 unnamed protein product [Vitrella brassicaformis CCMP3155]
MAASGESDVVKIEFPFTPYPTQIKFMVKAYQLLQEGGFGVFQSPTGTGKTLMIVCTALQWLRDNEMSVLKQQLVREPSTAAEANAAQPAKSAPLPLWLTQSKATREQEELQAWVNERLERLQQRKTRAAIIKTQSKQTMFPVGLPGPAAKKQKVTQEPAAAAAAGGGGSASASVSARPAAIDLEFLLNSICSTSGEEEHLRAETSRFTKPQILICSRTHEQLKQYKEEILRTSHAAKVVVVPLASRQQLCINQEVRSAAHSASHLTDLCRTKVDEGKCQYKKSSSRTADLALSEVLDIEDLKRWGSKESVCSCPYFGTREAAPDADVLLLPYNCILSRDTREALGIRIKGSVIVFDEAHNLIEAINSSHSCTITQSQLAGCRQDLEAYLVQYEKWLKGNNSANLKIFIKMCDHLHTLIQTETDNHTEGRSHTIARFLQDAQLEHFPLNDLRDWIRDPLFLRKLRGFSECRRRKLARQAGGPNAQYASSSLHTLVEFLSGLLAGTSDERILVWPGGSGSGVEGRLEIMNLNAEERFHDIVKDARAVLLAGGTMEPRREFAPLSSSLPAEKIVHFSGTHVVPPSQVFVSTVTNGPDGHPWKFDYASRSQDATLRNLTAFIASLCAAVPAGLVVFVPSFDFLAHLDTYIKSHPAVSSEIAKHKRVFVEQRAGARGGAGGGKAGSDGDELPLFRDFRQYVLGTDGRARRGALLFSVVGGKLSEGMNFKDDLARGVCVVGCPYPRKDLKIRQKMNFLDTAASRARREGEGDAQQRITGREYYQCLCMKAVNQCVGRAIRSRSDYGAILLIDSRYGVGATQQQLPEWIQKSLTLTIGQDTTQATMATALPSPLEAFFRRMQSTSRSN